MISLPRQSISCSNSSDGSNSEDRPPTDATNEASGESESEIDSSDSDDYVDTYGANFYEWKKNFAEKSRTKWHVKEGNKKMLYPFTSQCSP